MSSPSRHVRTRLYFTSESHIHSLLTVLRFGGLIDVGNKLAYSLKPHIFLISVFSRLTFAGVCQVPECNYLCQNPKDEQWSRAMDYIGAVSELNYLSQIVVMLYEDPTKDPSSDNRWAGSSLSPVTLSALLMCFCVSLLLFITF